MPIASAKKSRRRKRAAEPSRPTRAGKWTLRGANGVKILREPSLAKLDWLVHGFSTRPGGASVLEGKGSGARKTDEKICNLGFTDWDTRERVLANREKFLTAIGAGKMRPITLKQIHSDVVCGVSASSPAASGEAPQADALFTREPGTLLIVQTADCVPIVLADVKQRAVAAVHSGWRGTLHRIAAKTLGRMQMEFGTQPRDVVAVLGPSIGRCCYEVGSDVAKEFHSQFENARDWFEGPFDALAAGENDPNWLPWLTMRPPGHPPPAPTVQLDLIAANRAILIEAGVREENIRDSGYCTACRTDLFFSYRRERVTGRMMTAIGIR